MWIYRSLIGAIAKFVREAVVVNYDHGCKSFTMVIIMTELMTHFIRFLTQDSRPTIYEYFHFHLFCH
jgi:hypothetical protein